VAFNSCLAHIALFLSLPFLPVWAFEQPGRSSYLFFEPRCGGLKIDVATPPVKRPPPGGRQESSLVGFRTDSGLSQKIVEFSYLAPEV
jgi:hypothetical protein